jgi:hypothetical protein
VTAPEGDTRPCPVCKGTKYEPVYSAPIGPFGAVKGAYCVRVCRTCNGKGKVQA